jgi:hypothetical protein
MAYLLPYLPYPTSSIYRQSNAVSHNGMLFFAISWHAMSRKFSKAGPVIKE